MHHIYTIKINFTGGIISPGPLQAILEGAYAAGVRHVRFGLRQQLLLDVLADDYHVLEKTFRDRAVAFDFDTAQHPNIVSSYPAEGVFLSGNWLGEGIYKDIFDGFGYQPRLKVNISDNNQSFTPFFTGNLNWIASPHAHFWYLYVRFPKTNALYAWTDLVYSNDIPAVTQAVEEAIWQHRDQFYANDQADGDSLFAQVKSRCGYISKPNDEPLELPAFRLPYYEGFNRYGDRTWLGIYRRDEQFAIAFLLDLCRICLQTKMGQLCATPWKSLIVKGIEAKDRHLWDNVLTRHQINVRHAANELNWQVEDNARDGLELKQRLVKHLDKNDLRTFGVCFGIQTRPKSEVFGSVVIRKKPVLRFGHYGLGSLYDILHTDDFNPNSRRLTIFERNLPVFFLGEHIRRLCKTYLRTRTGQQPGDVPVQAVADTPLPTPLPLHLCQMCHTVYDPAHGQPEAGIHADTDFLDLPDTYTCPLCEAPKADFILAL